MLKGRRITADRTVHLPYASLSYPPCAYALRVCRRTYTDELQALSEAASHELRLVLETLGVPGLHSLLGKLQVPVDPARGQDLAYLLSCVVTACPGPGSLVPHLPRGAARVFEAGLEAFETDHCLTKRRLVQRCARLRLKFQAASAAAAAKQQAGGTGAATQHDVDDEVDDEDEDDEDEDEYTDEEEDDEFDDDEGMSDEEDDGVSYDDEDDLEDDYDDDLSAEDEVAAAATSGSRRRGGQSTGRGAGGAGNGTSKGGRYSCTLCGLGSLKRGCASCGLSICRVCWQVEESLPPGWLDTCTNAECRFTSCLACRRERPCVRCGVPLSSSEVGMLRRRRKTLVLAMNKLCGAAAATLAGAAPPGGAAPGAALAAGGHQLPSAALKGASTVGSSKASGKGAGSKGAASVQAAEAAAQAAADALLQEEEAERQAAEEKARKLKEKRDKKKQQQKGSKAAVAEAEAAAAAAAAAVVKEEASPSPQSKGGSPQQKVGSTVNGGPSPPPTPQPDASIAPAQRQQQTGKKAAVAGKATGKAVAAPASSNSTAGGVSQSAVDTMVSAASRACDALCSATDGGDAGSLDKAIASAEGLLGKWSNTVESKHPDAAAGLQMLMDVILAARAARRSIKPGHNGGAVPQPAAITPGKGQKPAPPPVQRGANAAVEKPVAASLQPKGSVPSKPQGSGPMVGGMPVQPGVMVAPMTRPQVQAQQQQQHYGQPPATPVLLAHVPGRMGSPGTMLQPAQQQRQMPPPPPQQPPHPPRQPPPQHAAPPVSWGHSPGPVLPSMVAPHTPAALPSPPVNGGVVMTPPGGGGAFAPVVHAPAGTGVEAAFGGASMWRPSATANGSGHYVGGASPAMGLWSPVMPSHLGTAPGSSNGAAPMAPMGLGNGAFSLGASMGGPWGASPLHNGVGGSPAGLWGAGASPAGSAPPSLPRSGTSSGNSSSEGVGGVGLMPSMGSVPRSGSHLLWGSSPGGLWDSDQQQYHSQQPTDLLVVESMLAGLLEPDTPR